MGLEQDVKIIQPILDRLNPNSTVLNITHAHCTDAATSQVVLKNYFNNISFIESNYHDIDRIVGQAKSSMYDIVILTDISCSTSEILDKHKNLILLDHHETAVHLHDPKKGRFVYNTECGAALTKRFIETVFNHDLSYLDDLVRLTNDNDMWIHDDPRSKELSMLYYNLWNEKFQRRFMEGCTDWTPEEAEYIRKTKHEIDTDYQNTEVFDFSTINGCMCYGTKYINDICDRLITEEGYDVVVFRNTNNKNVSIRSKGEVDVGNVVDTLGIGGGHKNAGGINEKDLPKLMSKLKAFEVELYERYEHIRK